MYDLSYIRHQSIKICEIFKNSHFEEHLQKIASG